MTLIQLQERIDRLKEDCFNQETLVPVSEALVFQAEQVARSRAETPSELFHVISALNLLNAAIKRKEFKKRLSYGMIKGNVSRILHFLALGNAERLGAHISYNQQEKCVYIRMHQLQFSFHNVVLSPVLHSYFSNQDGTTTWEGFRLQRIAGELFELAEEANSSSLGAYPKSLNDLYSTHPTARYKIQDVVEAEKITFSSNSED